MYFASYDGFSYLVNDPGFHSCILKGECEPYPLQISIVKTFLNEMEKKGISRNRTYIDVGAHCGTTVLPYSKLFKNVYGYEANKDNFDVCVSNLRLNSHVLEGLGSTCVVKNMAVSNEPCSGEMILEHGGNTGMFYFKKKENGSVKTVRIDDETYSENGEYDTLGSIDFMKIDTEGYELSVLKSAENTLKKWKPFLQVETNGCSESHFGVKKQEIIDYVLSLGYELFTLSDQAVKDPSNSYFW